MSEEGCCSFCRKKLYQYFILRANNGQCTNSEQFQKFHIASLHLRIAIAYYSAVI
jgi:hypothetical protein